MNTPLTPLRLRTILIAAASSTLLLQVHGAELAFDLLPEVENQQLGATFAAVGDINGDGVTDIAISDPGYATEGFPASGAAFIVSGKDGTALRTYLPEFSASSQYFGTTLAALDADGDGVLDLAVGAPGYAGSIGASAGTVRVFSGATGALISAGFGTVGSQYGVSLANAGDQNGDGKEDLFVGASTYVNGSFRGAVFIQSGADGSTLQTLQDNVTFSMFGTSVAAVGDVDGDGKPDLATGTPSYRPTGGTFVGRVVLVRSSDYTPVAQLIGTTPSGRMGNNLASAGDANGDGISDLLVGSLNGGTALLVSGADLTTILDLSVSGLPASQSINVGGALDFDDDGVQDYLIGSPALNSVNVANAGGVRIISGADSSVLFEQLATTAATGLGSGMKALPDFGFAFGESSLIDAETGGRGIGHVWTTIKEDVPPPPVDTDGDGITDDVDSVVNSIMDATVSILGVNSTVPNRVDTSGKTLADRYAAGLPVLNPKKPGPYVSSLAHLTNDLVKAGLLTPVEGIRIVASGAVGVVLTKFKR
ncbi:FG-GAP-like repeat-containing protein [Haloferula sp. BvORR071]|uniref:FG-GAP-like repeat-containing protein n=1 Tax=Haloferula sp. BvORR071 TaxID=1396141 RepID=UPI0005557444|nr:FG-GAP-like repeat-containing protein [Haloferula sp. BvORR071]